MPDVVNGYTWELYNLAEDFSQNNDLAAKMPDKLRDMKELFLVEATKYNVFPLDNDFLQRVTTPRPSATAGRTVFTYSGEMSGLPEGSAPNTLNKSYSITAEVEIPPGGAEGMLNTLGGRFGGYGLYLLKGKPVFAYNLLAVEHFRWEGPAALTPGKHTIMFDFKYDGPGFGKGGTGVLSVDGKEVASKAIPHTIPFIATVDETFDVGVDTRMGVDDNDYQPPFRFTGKLDKLTIMPKTGEEQATRMKTYQTHHRSGARCARIDGLSRYGAGSNQRRSGYATRAAAAGLPLPRQRRPHLPRLRPSRSSRSRCRRPRERRTSCSSCSTTPGSGSSARSAAASRRPRWTNWRPRGCGTTASTRPRCAARRGPRSSPAATTTRPRPASSARSRPDTTATPA